MARENLHRMKKIFIPLDFSPNSENALDYALAIAKVTDSSLCLFNSVFVASGSASMLVSTMEKVKKESQKSLDQLRSKVEQFWKDNDSNSSSEVFPIICEGLAVEKIPQYAAEEKADLIVMGTQGASGVEGVLLGSNTSNVIGKASSPVLAVPNNAKFHGLNRIVYASDWMNRDTLALHQLIEFAKPFGACIDVVHVIGENETVNPSKEEKARTTLMGKIDYDKVEFHLQPADDVTAGINSYLEKSGADLLAMLTLKRNFFEKIFKRSLTKKLAMHTNIPLLAFKE